MIGSRIINDCSVVMSSIIACAKITYKQITYSINDKCNYEMLTDDMNIELVE